MGRELVLYDLSIRYGCASRIRHAGCPHSATARIAHESIIKPDRNSGPYRDSNNRIFGTDTVVTTSQRMSRNGCNSFEQLCTKELEPSNR